ncbi:MAG TPA: SagB/ThcOx family dehydrogenase [Vicinamibacteria bacterium]|nr:SagB/ThcOx family dehydrogenase [Vicinamibacteria bacterium]
MAGGRVLYRRSPNLVGHWIARRLVLRNYATGVVSAASPSVIRVLDFFSDWRTPEALIEEMGVIDRAPVKRLLTSLVRKSLLLRSDRKRTAAEEGMDGWAEWNPSVGFLHSVSRDLDFESGEASAASFLRQRIDTRELPDPVKGFVGSGHVKLPSPRRSGVFPRVLLHRRTWRKFGATSLDASALGTLLELTFGVQAWMDLGALGRAPLKTSPSGGARHPIEAYVLVRRVSGVPPGLYYYDPQGHGLERLILGGASRIRRYLPGQPWYREASALVLMTAVFARTQWLYPNPRSYRAVLLEAGHLCQTFCLVATWLGLAPFETSALADSLIEKDLGIDGVRESVLYAAGVGPKPEGISWAPSIDGEPPPRWIRHSRGPRSL